MDNPHGHDTEHILGLDLGQASDPSALTVIRQRTPFRQSAATGERTEEGTPSYSVVWIRRFDLGTPYPDVVRQTAALQEAPQTGHDPPLVMDATGLGAPVVDAFHEEGLRPVQIVFTSGNDVTRSGRRFKVPKQDLVTTVQSLLQSDRLAIARGLEHAGQLVQEMRRFRVKVSDTGYARFEHATESDTDDILLSLACGLWHAERQKSRTRSVKAATVRL
jgi:hypothetical protein